jgi:hypothetical protein
VIVGRPLGPAAFLLRLADRALLEKDADEERTLLVAEELQQLVELDAGPDVAAGGSIGGVLERLLACA